MMPEPELHPKRYVLRTILVTLCALAFVVLAGFCVRWGLDGRPFVFPSRNVETAYERSSSFDYQMALTRDRRPFSADSLIYYQAALGLLAFAGTAIKTGRWRRRAWLVGSVVAFTVALISLIFEVMWVSTGVPYSNYLEDASAWRYALPIAALVLGVAGWAALFLLLRYEKQLEATFRRRETERWDRRREKRQLKLTRR